MSIYTNPNPNPHGASIVNKPLSEPITIGDKDYKYADLSPEALKWLGYIQFADDQLSAQAASMEKLQILREGCYARLLQNLPPDDAA